MDHEQIPLLSAMMRRLNWLQQRQQVLAHNVANADTPGFKANDLKPQDQGGFRSMLQAQAPAISLAVTDAKHVRSPRVSGAAVVQKDRDAFETSLSGNNVVIEQQMMKISETQMAHQTITNLYRKHLGMLRMALGRNG